MARPYRLGKRFAASRQTRERIVVAARELLVARDGLSRFTIDRVASRAGVARMTVYYQFGSRLGLIEAIADGLALRQHIPDLQAALARDSLAHGVADFIDQFAQYYAADRPLLRCLKAMAALNPAVFAFTMGREEGRRVMLRQAVRRAVPRATGPSEAMVDEVAAVLFTLTDFAIYESLAGERGDLGAAARTIQRLAQAALAWLPPAAGGGGPRRRGAITTRPGRPADARRRRSPRGTAS